MWAGSLTATKTSISSDKWLRENSNINSVRVLTKYLQTQEDSSRDATQAFEKWKVKRQIVLNLGQKKSLHSQL